MTASLDRSPYIEMCVHCFIDLILKTNTKVTSAKTQILWKLNRLIANDKVSSIFLYDGKPTLR